MTIKFLLDTNLLNVSNFQFFDGLMIENWFIAPREDEL